MKPLKFLLVCFYLALSACSSQPSSQSISNRSKPLLRIGVSPHYEPIIYRDKGQLTGLEVDFGNALAESLGRKPQFVEYAWGDIFTALENREIDIVMSGVSITPERAATLAFAPPYLSIGQMAVIRLQDAATLSNASTLFSGRYRIGYSNGTTGEQLVRSRLTDNIKGFSTNDAGIAALKTGSIDAFIHDAPTVWRLANAQGAPSEVQLLGLYKPLTSEFLAWATASDNSRLQTEVESVYRQWEANGFLKATVRKWIPVIILTEDSH